MAAEYGSAQVVAELARRVDDVDVMQGGRTALWRAVAADRLDNARALVAAGADPWRDMMSGWSPGRLSSATPTPDLFGSQTSLTPEDLAVVRESRRLIAVLGNRDVEGLGIACVAGIDVTEAVRRLNVEIVDGDAERMMAAWMDDPFSVDAVWATDVPGGCVLAQPNGFEPSSPGVTKALSVGTTCYSMFANPKSGNQGRIARDGRIAGWDLHPGGGPNDGDEGNDVLLSYLYQHQALAYCFAFTGLRPADDRAVVGPPDVWLRFLNRDHWN